MQLGFVIDHARCIGCHACTVACKSENAVPLGKFRTWVKYTEQGEFPRVRRSFAVLRCNQCSDAPCVTICPVRALARREDGIVDVDPDRCIGCKACLQGCPYDALYLNDDTGTAEKCHFCAHRAEIGLAPACAVVCPTEAIIPGDFHDPASLVSRMRAAGKLRARKPEAGTRPNVWYRDVAEAAIAPLRTNAAGGYLWTEPPSGPQLDAQRFEAATGTGGARTTYDVAHPTPWGWRVSAYLLAKSLSAGAILVVAPLLLPVPGRPRLSPRGSLGVTILAGLLLALTTALLVADLRRPERCLHLLRYFNRDSWLARGAFVLAAFGAVLVLWGGLGAARLDPGPLAAGGLAVALALAAALAAVYTAWLFRQAKGRALWLRRDLAPVLLVHAVAAGSALLLLPLPASLLPGWPGAPAGWLRAVLVLALVAHLGQTLAEGRMAPPGRGEEYRRALRLITHGPFARRHRWLGVGLGSVLPLALLLAAPGPGAAWTLAAVLVLVGLGAEQEIRVRAGQALPIS